jgi:hypothetical protein
MSLIRLFPNIHPAIENHGANARPPKPMRSPVLNEGWLIPTHRKMGANTENRTPAQLKARLDQLLTGSWELTQAFKTRPCESAGARPTSSTSQ